jgi:[acyl-carrier-protein] S-malonyltransferase
LVPRLAAVLDGIAMERPQVPVIANVTARSVEEPAALRKILLEQLDHPVRWSETVSHLLDLGVDTFLHFGPGKVVIRTAGRELIRTRSIRDVQTLRAAELFLDPMGGPCRAGSEARAGRR